MSDQRNKGGGGFNNLRDKFPGQPPPPRQDAGQEKSLKDVWPDYLSAGYFKAGSLDPDYVKRDKVLPLVRAFANAKPALTNSQLRRFFQHTRAVEAMLRRGGTKDEKRAEVWEGIEFEFRKLDIAAADAHGKKDRKIPKIFHDFIEANSRAVVTADDFLKGFIPHFEAVVGFSSGILKERDRP